ncbi:MAG: DUF1501 domain-containing protein [Planctomycetaceae bacterium]|nr:DUF1501 domain-containing protein [Planctomycetaceae bacterium]
MLCDPVLVLNLTVTIRHLLGIDQTRLTYCVQGRDLRPSDTHGDVLTRCVGRTAFE